MWSNKKDLLLRLSFFLIKLSAFPNTVALATAAVLLLVLTKVSTHQTKLWDTKLFSWRMNSHLHTQNFNNKKKHVKNTGVTLPKTYFVTQI